MILIHGWSYSERWFRVPASCAVLIWCFDACCGRRKNMGDCTWEVLNGPRPKMAHYYLGSYSASQHSATGHPCLQMKTGKCIYQSSWEKQIWVWWKPSSLSLSTLLGLPHLIYLQIYDFFISMELIHMEFLTFDHLFIMMAILCGLSFSPAHFTS